MFAAGELALSSIILANLSLSLGFQDMPSWTRRRCTGPKKGSLRNANIAVNLTALAYSRVSFQLALSCHFRSPQPSDDSLIRGPLNQHCSCTGLQTITCFRTLFSRISFLLPVARSGHWSEYFKQKYIWMCFAQGYNFENKIVFQKTVRRFSAIFTSNVNIVMNVKSCSSWLISVFSKEAY